MRTSLRIPAWVFLIMTTLLAGYAGWFVKAIKAGFEGNPEGLSFLAVLTWLGISGVITLIMGVLCAWRARKHGEAIPMVSKLCILMGIVAIVCVVLFAGYR